MCSRGKLLLAKYKGNKLTYHQCRSRPLFTGSSRCIAEQLRGKSAYPSHITLAYLRETQNDSTRAQDLEIHIQNRVHAELVRLAQEQTKSLKELQDKISAESPSKPSQTPDLSRASVQKEIEGLKKKLAKRKLREDVAGDRQVEKAKNELVHCLRINDRRPLDCWKEVETFKAEVGRIEKRFLSRVLE